MSGNSIRIWLGLAAAAAGFIELSDRHARKDAIRAQEYGIANLQDRHRPSGYIISLISRASSALLMRPTGPFANRKEVRRRDGLRRRNRVLETKRVLSALD